jgi:hypothetical protein
MKIMEITNNHFDGFLYQIWNRIYSEVHIDVKNEVIDQVKDRFASTIAIHIRDQLRITNETK